jgi:hypothetical protein
LVISAPKPLRCFKVRAAGVHLPGISPVMVQGEHEMLSMDVIELSM